MAFHTAFKTARGSTCEVFKNPSHREVRAIQSWTEQGSVRGFLVTNGDLLVWDSYGDTHDDVRLALGLSWSVVVPVILNQPQQKLGWVTITECYRFSSGGKEGCKATVRKFKPVITTALNAEWTLRAYGDEA